MIYTEATKHEYQAPPCPLCGGTSTVDWVDITEISEEPGSRFVPGYLECDGRCSRRLSKEERGELLLAQQLRGEHLQWRF